MGQSTHALPDLPGRESSALPAQELRLGRKPVEQSGEAVLRDDLPSGGKRSHFDLAHSLLEGAFPSRAPRNSYDSAVLLKSSLVIFFNASIAQRLHLEWRRPTLNPTMVRRGQVDVLMTERARLEHLIGQGFLAE
jgi:hypothetical protein